MNKKYYIYGKRPLIEEINDQFDTIYAFQWDTGEFKEDMSYTSKIMYDPSGDSEIVSKEEFEEYVEKLRKEKGFI